MGRYSDFLDRLSRYGWDKGRVKRPYYVGGIKILLRSDAHCSGLHKISFLLIISVWLALNLLPLNDSFNRRQFPQQSYIHFIFIVDFKLNTISDRKKKLKGTG